MKVLDLFCGSGGAGMGYAQAGHTVTGVDLYPQDYYPFRFRQGDAMEILREMALTQDCPYNIIHASPPCQAYSIQKHKHPGVAYTETKPPDYLAEVLDLCERIPAITIVENVPMAQRYVNKEHSVMLCGSHFDAHVWFNTYRMSLRRHRLFWLTGFEVPQPECDHHATMCIEVTGRMAKAPFRYRRENPDKSSGIPHEVTSELMGINWIPKRAARSLSEAIPPFYTRHLARYIPPAG